MNNHKFFATVLMLTFLAAGAVYADTWTTYNSNNTGGAVGNNTVNSSSVDSGSVKWFGTNGGGVAKYDGTTWTKYGTAAGLAGNTVNHIDYDSSGNKWVATSTGLSKYAGSSWTKYTTGNSGLAGNNCLTVATQSTTIWIGTYSNGVSKYDGTTWTTYTSANSGLANNRVLDAVVDSSGNKWFATLTGASKYDGTTWAKYTTANSGLANNDVKAVAIAPNGDLWFGTAGGVNKFNGSSWTTYLIAQGLAENDTSAIDVASDGTVWAGHTGSGVSKFTGSTPWTVYTTSNGLANNNVNGIDTEGTTVVWFATGGGGISKLEIGGVTAPIADFDGSPTSGGTPLTVNFTDTSTNTPTSWSWTFGDSGTSTAQNPSHQYTSAGTYTVTLTASNAGGSNMKTRTNYITVSASLNADFTANKTSGYAPLTVTFTDTSTGNICNWKWKFDANDPNAVWNNSSYGNPTPWTYNNAGSYTVSLEITECGTSTRNTEIKAGYITVSPAIAPTAAFSGNPVSGNYPLMVSFTDQTTGSVTAWSWAFGDSGTSTAANPSHQYTAQGLYTVSLTVTGPVGSDDEVKADYIMVTPPPPVSAEFSANPTSGNAPLSVNFTDQSTGTVTAWSWAFGDSGTSTAENPGHNYTTVGVYNVSLTATGPQGSGSLTKTSYITVKACTAAFTGSPTSGVYPLAVSFTDSSTGSITSRSWTFGDGGTSTATNPSHTYTYAGAFTVALTASGSYGSNTETKSSYINVTAPATPVAAFTGSPTQDYHPLTVNFTDQSTGSISAWSWVFGDSGTSTAQSPSHVYNNAGVYTVSLTVTGPSGSNLLTKSNYITVMEFQYTETWTTYNSSNTGSAIGNNTIDGVASSGGTAWICTNGGGLAKYDGTTWTKYTTSAGLANNTVYDIAFDGSGNKWVATNGGVNKYTGSSWTKYTTGNSALANNNTRSIAVDNNSDVWVCTASSGICKFNGSSWTKYNSTNSGLANNSTTDIAVDSSNNNKWITTTNGVSKFDGTTWTNYGHPPLANASCKSVAVVSGNIWVATTSGVNKFNGSSWITYTTSNGLAKDDSLSIGGDSDGYVWVGSNGSGASKFTGSSWSKYNTTNSGLANNTVNGVGSDGLARWFGTGGSGASKLQLTVINPNLPDANFTGSPTSGTIALAVTFTDLSTGSPTSWNWAFGDSSSGTDQNPTHTYSDPGTYTVSLTVTNAFGSDIKTRTNYITTINPVPIPDFTAVPTDGIAPLGVMFTDKSVGCIDTWKYDFDGNGGFESSDSSNGNEKWTYSNVGVYTVCLKVRDCSTGIYYNCKKVDLINVRAPLPPDANFVASKTVGGFAPQRIDFTDTSAGDYLSGWSWTFGDGGTSTAQNPSHIYNNGGTYTVALTASSAYGTDSLTRTNYIVVGPVTACDTNFVGSPTSGFAALKVQFTDTTYGSVTKWSWTFGDNGTSTDMNPLYTYNVPGIYTVALTTTGPLNSDHLTRTNYITAQLAPAGGSGFAIPDSAGDLSNLHPHLVMKGYGTENGLWAKAQSTHSEIWARLTSTARTGATFPGIERNMTSQQSAFAYLISKINGYGQYCQDMVHSCMNYGWIVGGNDTEIASMETFWGYCIAYDAIVDDPAHGGPTWLSSSDKATVLANISNFVQNLNFAPGDTWRLRPTHNFMVCRAGDHAAGLYCLRGEPGYENVFNTSRQYDLIYHNERVNGLCDHGQLGVPAPLSNNGPRPADGFPYEGPSYGAYQGSRALVHRYIMELNEYPNPDTVLDENKSGFSQNFVLAWMALSPPGLDEWADTVYNGDHGVVQAMRYHAAINKAVGVSDTSIIPAGKMARVAEWYTRTLIPTPKGKADAYWWQGFEYIWYDATIEPLSPDDAGLPLYVHLDDTEFHMYRDNWNLGSPTANDTYVFFGNRGHDGHNYWNEKQSGSDVPSLCQVQTSSHDGMDNGDYGMYRNGDWLVVNAAPQGNTDSHNCLLVDGTGNCMDGLRGYQAYALITADCIGAVDSDYGHAIDAVMGGIYPAITSGIDGYHRYFFVIRNPMCVLVADELEAGHTANSLSYSEMPLTKVSDSLYTSTESRHELLYPASGFTASGTDPISITTTSQKLLWMVHSNPSGVTFAKSYPGNLCVATIGSNTVIYNPTGGTYTQGNVSGNAKLFAQSTGGAIIFKATSATGSQYGVSCDVAVNLSAKGRKASICVYGTGNHTVTVTSPYGTDAFANIPAGQTVARVLTGRSVAPPVADFIAIPTVGWNTYVAPEFVSYSSGWITDYLWEFGDGEWSTDMAPHHKYAQAGIYTTKLTVAGPGGSSSETRNSYITINDFGNYNWPDYILTSPSTAWTAFTAALTSIEASQTLHYTEKPEWCDNGKWTPWCDVVTTLCGHGGGGRILFGYSNTIVGGDWDTRIDPIKTWGDSSGKYDFIGDNLIIDGEDRNIGFVYDGTLDCGQAENGQALRLHGVDNIVKNFTWSGYHDGIHMRHGMRMLFDGVQVPKVCEDATTMNGVGGSCVYCTLRNSTYGSSADKTFMFDNHDGWRHLAPAIDVIDGMHSTDASQAIRQTSSEGGTKSILIVRNGLFEGSAQGPRFGGHMDDKPPAGKSGAVCIFENNYATTTKGGNCGGMRIGEGIHIWVRNNTFENSSSHGIYFYTTGVIARIEGNIFQNNTANALDTNTEDPCETKIDLGGGLADVWEVDPAGTFYGASAAARAAVPSYGQNTFHLNGGSGNIDVINSLIGTPQTVLKAENNFWDHTDVSSVLSNDVSGNVDVDPLGVNLSQ